MSKLIKSTSSECRVYVGNLPQFVKNRDLEDVFDKFGPIKAIDIHNRFDPAFAFIEFEDPRDAGDSVKEKDGERFEGKRLRVEFPKNGEGGSKQKVSSTSDCRIYVGNLPQNIKERELEDIFDKFGPIKAVDIHNKMDPAFAFIEFEDERDAGDSVKEKDGERYEGKRLRVEFPRNSQGSGGAQRTTSTTSDCRIYVGNIPQNVKEREMEDLFDKYGPIKAVDIHNKFDPAFAFIEFEDQRDASDAVSGKDGDKFEGKRIRVEFPKNSSRGGGGGDSGRDRDRSRDRDNDRGRSSGRSAPPKRSDNRVLVSGLPTSGSWQDLKDHMREAGEILYADVYKDGTAICEFAKFDDMKWAVKYLDDTKFKSHEAETSYVRVKRDDGGNRSRSGSPKRSRSRSPR